MQNSKAEGGVTTAAVDTLTHTEAPQVTLAGTPAAPVFAVVCVLQRPAECLRT